MSSPRAPRGCSSASSTGPNSSRDSAFRPAWLSIHNDRSQTLTVQPLSALTSRGSRGCLTLLCDRGRIATVGATVLVALDAEALDDAFAETPGVTTTGPMKP